MAVTTREELKQYCLRKLGKPVININADDSQLEDRIDEALQVYQEKHYDATERVWVSYPLTQLDIDRNYILVPDNIMSVLGLLPYSELIAQSNIFSYQYQIAMTSLMPWRPLDSIDYFMKVTDYDSVSQLTNVTPSWEYTFHARKLIVNASLKNLGLGYPFAVQVQKIVDPETYKSIYNDKWLKEYTTALFKRQWGENMKKFVGMQLLGGIEFNGQQIFDEAVQEIESLETTLQETYQWPTDFFVG